MWRHHSMQHAKDRRTEEEEDPATGLLFLLLFLSIVEWKFWASLEMLLRSSHLSCCRHYSPNHDGNNSVMSSRVEEGECWMTWCWGREERKWWWWWWWWEGSTLIVDEKRKKVSGLRRKLFREVLQQAGKRRRKNPFLIVLLYIRRRGTAVSSNGVTNSSVSIASFGFRYCMTMSRYINTALS